MIEFMLVALEYSLPMKHRPSVFTGRMLYKKTTWPVVPAIGGDWVVESDGDSAKIDNHRNDPFTKMIGVELVVQDYLFKRLMNDPSWSTEGPE